MSKHTKEKEKLLWVSLVGYYDLQKKKLDVT